jgi:hypothetical protein
LCCGWSAMKTQRMSASSERSVFEKKIDQKCREFTFIGIGGAVFTVTVLLIIWFWEVLNSEWEQRFFNEFMEDILFCLTVFISMVPESLPVSEMDGQRYHFRSPFDSLWNHWRSDCHLQRWNRDFNSELLKSREVLPVRKRLWRISRITSIATITLIWSNRSEYNCIPNARHLSVRGPLPNARFSRCCRGSTL